MSNLQPKKYYEACITYNIIVELNRMGKKVYPYSISQRQEKEEGFDFGYCINKSLEEQIYNWRNRWLIGRINRLNEKSCIVDKIQLSFLIEILFFSVFLCVPIITFTTLQLSSPQPHRLLALQGWAPGPYRLYH